MNSIKSLMQPSIVYLQEKQVKKSYSKKGQITDMNIFNFSVPQDITVGKGSLAKLPEIAKKLGCSHAFIISGPHLAKMGLVEKAADYLKTVDIKTDAFTEIEANPSVATVEKATEKFKE